MQIVNRKLLIAALYKLKMVYLLLELYLYAVFEVKPYYFESLLNLFYAIVYDIQNKIKRRLKFHFKY